MLQLVQLRCVSLPPRLGMRIHDCKGYQSRIHMLDRAARFECVSYRDSSLSITNRERSNIPEPRLFLSKSFFATYLNSPALHRLKKSPYCFKALAPTSQTIAHDSISAASRGSPPLGWFAVTHSRNLAVKFLRFVPSNLTPSDISSLARTSLKSTNSVQGLIWTWGHLCVTIECFLAG